MSRRTDRRRGARSGSDAAAGTSPRCFTTASCSDMRANCPVNSSIVSRSRLAAPSDAWRQRSCSSSRAESERRSRSISPARPRGSSFSRNAVIARSAAAMRDWMASSPCRQLVHRRCVRIRRRKPPRWHAGSRSEGAECPTPNATANARSTGAVRSSDCIWSSPIMGTATFPVGPDRPVAMTTLAPMTRPRHGPACQFPT